MKSIDQQKEDLKSTIIQYVEEEDNKSIESPLEIRHNGILQKRKFKIAKKSTFEIEKA